LLTRSPSEGQRLVGQWHVADERYLRLLRLRAARTLDGQLAFLQLLVAIKNRLYESRDNRRTPVSVHMDMRRILLFDATKELTFTYFESETGKRPKAKDDGRGQIKARAVSTCRRTKALRYLRR